MCFSQAFHLPFLSFLQRTLGEFWLPISKKTAKQNTFTYIFLTLLLVRLRTYVTNKIQFILRNDLSMLSDNNLSNYQITTLNQPWNILLKYLLAEVWPKTLQTSSMWKDKYTCAHAHTYTHTETNWQTNICAKEYSQFYQLFGKNATAKWKITQFLEKYLKFQIGYESI